VPTSEPEEPQPEEPQPEESRPVERRMKAATRRRLLLASAWACGVLALVGGSTVFGWWLATSTVVAGTQNPGPEIVEVPVPGSLTGNSVMPDVRGLDPETALQVLADAGVPVAGVTTTERPAAGPSGVILAQTPVFGTIDPTEVLLVVSAPAAVPEVVGLEVGEAASLLIELGARVDRIEIFDPDAEVGVVTAVDPVAGSDLPEVVRVTVTAEPGTARLSQLSFRGNCSTTSRLTMDGVQYAHGLECSASTAGRETTWQFGKAATVLEGTVGVPDDAEPGTSVGVRILGDGAELGNYTVAYGEPQHIELRVAGVIQLKIVVTGASGTEAGLGDLSVLGARAPLTALPHR
jgi:Uncharacterized protein conserved in bacteria